MTARTMHIPDPSPPEPMLPRIFRVVSTREETYDTTTLILEPEDGQALVFQPGQYTMLYVFGVGEVPISVSGDPGIPETLVHTIRSVGAVTRALIGLRPGDVVGVRGLTDRAGRCLRPGTKTCWWLPGGSGWRR